MINFPSHWQTDRIGNVFGIKQGKSLSRHKQTGDKRRRFLRTANVFWGRLDMTTLDEMTFTEKECSILALETGDLLVCEGGDIGRTARWRGDIDDCYYQNHLHRLRRLTDNVLPYFVMYWMQAAMTQLNVYEGTWNKTTIPNLSRSCLAEFLIPLPPLPEQKKIAAVLLKIQRAIETQEKIIQSLRDLKKSTMQHLFTHGLRGEKTKMTEIGEIPESWEIQKISELADITAGGTPSRGNPVYWENGEIPWVKTGEIDYCIISATEEHITEQGLRNSSAKLFPQGTLLLAMYGQGKTRGKVALLGAEAATNQACAAITPRIGVVETQFLYHYLTWSYDRLRSKSHGAQQPNLNAKIIADFSVVVPSMAQQINILETLSALDRKVVSHESKKAALQDLFKTTLNKLMTGNIRVKDLYIDVKEVEG